ncbi:MAG: hypothetical protein YHS30scaffold667_26 [Phage 65_10]|nr:MAG: hypothetical protein YHS30scaffold667_26 [Phage 65_10]
MTVPLDDPTRAAVRAGFQDVLDDPDTYRKVISSFRDQAGTMARDEAGNWILGWLKWAFGRAFVTAVLIVVLWKVGGIPAVLTYFGVQVK